MLSATKTQTENNIQMRKQKHKQKKLNRERKIQIKCEIITRTNGKSQLEKDLKKQIKQIYKHNVSTEKV
jgi:hypothetical protein